MEQGMDQGVGAQIKRLREERDWSMAKLAVEADMSVSGVSMIENGKRNLTTTTLAKLARAFGVEVRDLFPLGQASLPDFNHGEGFDAWIATLEHYKSLRTQISDFDALGPAGQRVVLDKSLELLQDLRKIHNSEDLELGLLHDAIHHAVLRMVAVCELQQERGHAGADVVEIEKYKARLRLSA